MRNNKECILNHGKLLKKHMNEVLLAEIKKDMELHGKTISDEKWEEFVKKVEAL